VIHWKSFLKADPTAWLLEDENPSVKYLTLREILEKPESASEIKSARKNIMETGVIPRILAKQEPGGYWEKEEDFYIRTKYKGTVWQLIILAELLADREDPRIKKACEFILEWSQDRESGGFSYRGSKNRGGQHSGVIPCLTGNMTWSLIRFGYKDDLRVRRAVGWIVSYQRFDDGVKEAPKGWPYDRFEPCWGKHTCMMGVAKGLKALAEIPPEKRDENIKTFLRNGVEFILKHRLYKKSHDSSQAAKPKWTKLWFPLMWDIDVLELLLILTGLGYKEERMQDAVDLVLSKQDHHGRWNLEMTYNGRFQVNIEQKGKPSKWVTLNALRMLKRYFG
jgi:hypothetical protein